MSTDIHSKTTIKYVDNKDNNVSTNRINSIKQGSSNSSQIHKKYLTNSHSEVKHSLNQSDDLDDIIHNFSQIDPQDSKKNDNASNNNENLNNLSNLIAIKKLFPTHLHVLYSNENSFVFNNKKKGQNSTILNNGCLMDISQSKLSNKEINNQPPISSMIYHNNNLKQRMDNMINMNDHFNAGKVYINGHNKENTTQVQLSCCSKKEK